MRQAKTYLIILLSLLSIVVNAQKAGDVVSENTVAEGGKGWVDRHFTQQEIPDDVFRRMQGRSFTTNCTVKRSELRYLRLLHRNAEGRTVVGELVCNKRIAADLLDIFRKLYDASYPIERMVLIDYYDADDERSMTANNTSCFNFRFITGSRTRVSLHGQGLAIDINPLYNPYVKGNTVAPKAGRKYATNRTKKRIPLMIERGDLCHRLFVQHGFSWGGAWKSQKDYQHFEKRP